jgi:hypothetical protein
MTEETELVKVACPECYNLFYAEVPEIAAWRLRAEKAESELAGARKSRRRLVALVRATRLAAEKYYCGLSFFAALQEIG